MNTIHPDNECHAYNAAFYELGLRWCWDERTWQDLSRTPCDETRIKSYLREQQPHMLTAYDADFLVGLIKEAKERALKLSGNSRSNVDWKSFQSAEVGV